VITLVTYDPDCHLFVIPQNDYPKLEDYVKEKGLHALMRNYEQICTIKAIKLDIVKNDH
jgi:hypothetical protein